MNQPKSYQIVHRQYFDKRSRRGHTVYVNHESAKYMDRAPLPFLYWRHGSIIDIDPAKDERVFSEWTYHVHQFMRVVGKAYRIDHGKFCWVFDEIPADLALVQNLAEIHPFNSESPISVVCWVAEINRLLLPNLLKTYNRHAGQSEAGRGRGAQQTKVQKLKWDEWQLEVDAIQDERAKRGQSKEKNVSQLANWVKKRLKSKDKVGTIAKRIHP